MRIKKTTAAAVAAAASFGLVASMQPASAAGENSLGSVLLPDGPAAPPAFDNNGNDYDIVANLALVAATQNADSPLLALLDGTKKLTVFVPQDKAFVALGKSLGLEGETAVGDALKGLPAAVIQDVLLYHVVAGKTVTSKQVAKLKGKKANLKMANGKKVKVIVKKKKVFLQDLSKNTTTKNAQVVKKDINKGNNQLGHGINGVLLPADLNTLIAG